MSVSNILEIKTVNSKGLQFIADREGGFRLKPYYDTSHIPTISAGCTYYEDGRRVKITDPAITLERAKALFHHLLPIYEKGVWSVTRDDINQNNFNALVSICFNIGVSRFKGSTLLRRVNANPHDPSIREAFYMWRFDEGKPILLPRRKLEASLYFLPV